MAKVSIISVLDRASWVITIKMELKIIKIVMTLVEALGSGKVADERRGSSGHIRGVLTAPMQAHRGREQQHRWE